MLVGWWWWSAIGPNALQEEGGDLTNMQPTVPKEAIKVEGTVRRLFLARNGQAFTPDGPVTLSVPKHAQSGQEARLKGKGVKRAGKHGDLYVRFLIKLPTEDSEAIEQAVTTLENAMTGDVRGGIHF